MDITGIRIEMSTLMRFASMKGWSIMDTFENVSRLTCDDLFTLCSMGDKSGKITVDALYKELDERGDISLMEDLALLVTNQLKDSAKKKDAKGK